MSNTEKIRLCISIPIKGLYGIWTIDFGLSFSTFRLNHAVVSGTWQKLQYPVKINPYPKSTGNFFTCLCWVLNRGSKERKWKGVCLKPEIVRLYVY